MQILTVSQIQRNLHLLQNFDIIKVVDKRKNIIKGYFVSIEHKDEIQKIENAHKKRNLSQFLGVWKDKDIDEKSIKQQAWR